MGRSKKIKKDLVFGIIALFIVSAVSYMVIGLEVSTTNGDLIEEDYAFYRFDEHHFPESYSSEKHLHREHADDATSTVLIPSKETTRPSLIETKKKEQTQTTTSSGPMDSPWPMYMHDAHHTGRSPYSTADNLGQERWRFIMQSSLFFISPSIDNDSVIYIPGDNLYAIYPNGTLKWTFEPIGWFDDMCPAIDENGTIYVGSSGAGQKFFYALNPDGTVKWKIGNGYMYAPPSLGDDGTIYYTVKWYEKSYIYALHPNNGTLKWKYYTSNNPMHSSPAIGDDGSIYCGSIDGNLYALYPNGTLKWKFNTGGWVHGSPTIGDDGTIYIGSDNGLYALYPNNGTRKWRCSIGAIWGSPVLDEDDTLYVGDWDKRFYAIYPNGTIKWTYDAPGRIWFTSPAISEEGIIFFGTTSIYDGGYGRLVALDHDGTEQWTQGYGDFESAPAIGKDGTIYVASIHWSGGVIFWHLRAFGELDPNAPEAPTIIGETDGGAGVEYEYMFSTIDPNGDDVFYNIEWGDGEHEDWFGPYNSGEEVVVSHTWDEQDTYTIRARAKDTNNLWGPWGELEVTMPVNQQSSHPLFNCFFERFPNAFPILRSLLGL